MKKTRGKKTKGGNGKRQKEGKRNRIVARECLLFFWTKIDTKESVGSGL